MCSKYKVQEQDGGCVLCWHSFSLQDIVKKLFTKMQVTRDTKDGDSELSGGKHRYRASFSRSSTPECSTAATEICVASRHFFASGTLRARQLPRGEEGSCKAPCACSIQTARGQWLATHLPVEFTLAFVWKELTDNFP